MLSIHDESTEGSLKIKDMLIMQSQGKKLSPLCESMVKEYLEREAKRKSTLKEISDQKNQDLYYSICVNKK